MSKPKMKPTPYLFAVRDPRPGGAGPSSCTYRSDFFLKMDDDDFGEDQ
jgi:hypothetical protein